MSLREKKLAERILLVAVAMGNRERWEAIDNLEELAALTVTAGGEVIEKILQIRDKPDSRTFVGKGKLQYIKAIAVQLKIDLVIFDNALTPVQLRVIEEELGRRTIDRTALILDIFALHAQSAEAKTQVELAQLEYNYTKLIGWGREMSRLGGRSGALGGRALGIGTRGPGETKLESDRRRIKERITRLKRELISIEKERSVQRRRRKRLLRIAMAGYTNAGKSTLLNALAGDSTPVSSMLFSTLDSATRSFELLENVHVVLTDTVGFIKNLPAQLVASFRATLSEIAEADIILHVVDASDRKMTEKIDVVEQHLEELGATYALKIMVFNKSDLFFDEQVKEKYSRKYENSVFVSALKKEGLDILKERIKELSAGVFLEVKVTIPHSLPQWENRFYEAGDVVKRLEMEDSVTLIVRGYRSLLSSLEKEFSCFLRDAGT